MTKQIIFSLIGGIIGFASSYFMWKMQNKYEKKNIAKAFILEIVSLEESLKIFTKMFENPPPDPKIKYINISQPFYTNGLFFSFRKEICFFNRKLSENLFTFYMNLLKAEELRQMDISGKFPSIVNEGMRDYISKTYYSIQELKKLLEKEL